MDSGLSACIVATIFMLYIVYSMHHHASKCSLTPPLGTMNFDCYVINMPGDVKRMRGFMQGYKKCDLSKTHSVIRHEAIVGKNIPIAEHTSSKALCEILRAERTSYRRKHYELTRGAIGCWLSHKNLWENILRTDKSCAVIFEDDCIMARNMHALMYDSQIPMDWDICLLGYMCNKCEPGTCGDVIEVNRFFGLHAYMINTKGIQKILKNPRMQLITKQIDSVLSDMVQDGDLNVYALPTPIAWQNNVDYATTIQMQLKKVKGVDEWE